MENSNEVQKTTNVGNEVLADVMPSLRCIWNGKATDDMYKITVGKTYPLIYNHKNYFAILNDDGDVDTYNKSCFELVSNEA
jgi:hypothetical protein